MGVVLTSIMCPDPPQRLFLMVDANYGDDVEDILLSWVLVQWWRPPCSVIGLLVWNLEPKPWHNSLPVMFLLFDQSSLKSVFASGMETCEQWRRILLASCFRNDRATRSHWPTASGTDSFSINRSTLPKSCQKRRAMGLAFGVAMISDGPTAKVPFEVEMMHRDNFKLWTMFWQANFLSHCHVCWMEVCQQHSTILP